MKRTSVSLVGLLCAVIMAPAGRASESAVVLAPAADSLYDHDVGIINFKALDTCYVGDTWEVPDRILVANLGRYSENFDVVMVWGAYLSRTNLNLIVGGMTWVSPQVQGSMVFDSAGTFAVFKCSTECTGDENPYNDGGWEWVVVLPRPGLMDDETAFNIGGQAGLSTTVIDVALFRSLVLRSEPRLHVIDCTGRAVVPERVGRGVYLLISSRPKKVVVR